MMDMYATVGTYTKKQIASIVSSSEKEIKLKMMNVQKQNGGCDCGLLYRCLLIVSWLKKQCPG